MIKTRTFTATEYREFERFIRIARARGKNGFDAITLLIEHFQLNRAEQNQIILKQWHLCGPNNEGAPDVKNNAK